MTAEQFIDAVWTITGTQPAKPVKDLEKPRKATGAGLGRELGSPDALSRTAQP